MDNTTSGMSKEWDKGFGDACCDHTCKLKGSPGDSDYNKGYSEGFKHTRKDKPQAPATLGNALNTIDALGFANEALKQDKAKLLTTLERLTLCANTRELARAIEVSKQVIAESKAEVSVALADAKLI